MDMYSIMYIKGEHSDRSMRDAEFFFKRNGLLEESGLGFAFSPKLGTQRRCLKLTGSAFGEEA